LGRRYAKLIYGWTGSSWLLQENLLYVYNGWNLIQTIDSSTSVNKNYFWGLDLSGTTQGAGGVGGLLMVQDGGTSYLPVYDGNGNVSGLLSSADGSLDAAYEYDAFGKVLRESGPYAASNPLQFSTKYTDVESGLVYYGQRYYSPSLGRFINKDPAGESGGVNLYGFCGNNGITGYDVLGLTPPVLKPVDPKYPLGYNSDPTTQESLRHLYNALAGFQGGGWNPGNPYGLPVTPDDVRSTDNQLYSDHTFDWSQERHSNNIFQQTKDLTESSKDPNNSGGLQNPLTSVLDALRRWEPGTNNSSSNDVELKLKPFVVTGTPEGDYSDDGSFDPNSAVSGYGAPGADCSIVTVQKIQKAFGVHVDSRDTIIHNFGVEASNFAPDGTGLPGKPSQIAGYLNKALNPSGLYVQNVTVNSVQEFATLVNSYTGIALGTQVAVDGQILPVNHLVAAVNSPGGNRPTLTIYNPTGKGGSISYTPQQAMANGIPTNYQGASGKVWVVYWDD
jgi:RHS repeat-associated protein